MAASDNRQSSSPPREQEETPFSAILRRLVEATPGALSAAFADDEGETVDYHGQGDPDDIRLAAAHMGVLLKRLGLTATLNDKTGRLVQFRLSAEHGQLVTYPLGHGYQVTVILDAVATLPKLDEALELALVELRLEAGGVID